MWYYMYLKLEPNDSEYTVLQCVSQIKENVTNVVQGITQRIARNGTWALLHMSEG